MRRLPPGRPREAPGSSAFLPGAARPGVMAWVRLSPRCSRAPRRVGPPIPRDGRLASFLCSRAPRGMAGPIPVVQAWAAGLLASSSQIDARRAGGRSRRLAGTREGLRGTREQRPDRHPAPRGRSRGPQRCSPGPRRQTSRRAGRLATVVGMLAWRAGGSNGAPRPPGVLRRRRQTRGMKPRSRHRSGFGGGGAGEARQARPPRAGEC